MQRSIATSVDAMLDVGGGTFWTDQFHIFELRSSPAVLSLGPSDDKRGRSSNMKRPYSKLTPHHTDLVITPYGFYLAIQDNVTCNTHYLGPALADTGVPAPTTAITYIQRINGSVSF